MVYCKILESPVGTSWKELGVVIRRDGINKNIGSPR